MKRKRKYPLLDAYWAQHRKITGANERRGTLASGCLPGDAPRPRPRSPTGPVPLADQDKPLMAVMHKLMKSGDARSVSAAAKMVVAQAAGTGTKESKAKRLERRFRKRTGLH